MIGWCDESAKAHLLERSAYSWADVGLDFRFACDQHAKIIRDYSLDRPLTHGVLSTTPTIEMSRCPVGFDLLTKIVVLPGRHRLLPFA